MKAWIINRLISWLVRLEFGVTGFSVRRRYACCRLYELTIAPINPPMKSSK